VLITPSRWKLAFEAELTAPAEANLPAEPELAPADPLLASASEPRFTGIRSTTDGSAAAVWVESQISQVACAYPTTPSMPMRDGFAAEYANGKQNLWGGPLLFLEPESEHSSASACEGFVLAGGRVTNLTSGQGLILMTEVLYVIASTRLPVVFHIGALTSQFAPASGVSRATLRAELQKRKGSRS